MTPQEMEKMLRATIADRKLSAGERGALGGVLNDSRATEQQLAVYRAKAFELAREEIDDPRSREVLGWLEDVVKVMYPIKATATAAVGASEALFAPKDDLCGRLVRLFDTAKKTIDICVFTITDDRLASAILRAHGRGVVVRIVTDDEKSEDLGSDIERLARAGVKVVMDQSEAHMHHKYAVFDGTTLLNGSYNWTRSAAERNNENFLITTDPGLVVAFAKQFATLWKQFGGA